MKDGDLLSRSWKQGFCNPSSLRYVLACEPVSPGVPATPRTDTLTCESPTHETQQNRCMLEGVSYVLVVSFCFGVLFATRGVGTVPQLWQIDNLVVAPS